MILQGSKKLTARRRIHLVQLKQPLNDEFLEFVEALMISPQRHVLEGFEILRMGGVPTILICNPELDFDCDDLTKGAFM